MSQKSFHGFTNLYSLSKTLRFELKPIGQTLENIQTSDILSNDEHRAESYKLVKKIIDEYHKVFIEQALHDFQLSQETLQDYFSHFNISNKDESQKKKLEELQGKLQKEIARAFDTKRLFGKELIKEDLLSFVTNENDKKLVDEFKDFTTYFTGFHENRKNMYSDEDKATAIAFRLIHDNLPKFIHNISVFEKVAISPVAEHFAQIYNNLEEYFNVFEIGDIFRLDYYSDVLTQTQIDAYNVVINGKTLEDGTKIQGLNEYINLYNQKQTDRTKRLPKFTVLFKQILSDRIALSWIDDKFDNPNELLTSIESGYQELKKNVFEHSDEGENEHLSLAELINSLDEYDLSKIYIRRGIALTDISQHIFKDYSFINSVIKGSIKKENERKNIGKKNEETLEKYEERINILSKNMTNVSIAFIEKCIAESHSEIKVSPHPIVDYFKKFEHGEIDDDGNVEKDENGVVLNKKNITQQIVEGYERLRDFLNMDYSGNNLKDSEKKEIKDFLDSIKVLQWFIKPFKSDNTDKDVAFYDEFEKLWLELDKITRLYNMVRNYVTKKPYSTEKIKLNFENSTLADGWDVNKEHDNTTLILRKSLCHCVPCCDTGSHPQFPTTSTVIAGNDPQSHRQEYNYYLAILNKNHKKILDKDVAKTDGVCYEKMEYKLLPGANKMLPKVFFSNSRIREFNPSKQLLENYEKETHKKGATFNLQDCRNLIDFFKTSINKHEDWKHFDFHFLDTSTYRDLSGFYREVEQQGYKITFRNISENYINQLVDKGKLYLFQIYNKDFSPYSKGTPNMHTLYWKELFSPENLANVVYKLNGQAEVFYRKHSLNYTEKIWQKGHHYDKLKDKFDYPIISKRRYALDKFQFHVPITMNFKAIGNERINEQVNQYIKDNDIKHIIGIDRGERHLLYLSLIDLRGNIVQQFSLNEIVNEYNGNMYKTNYHDLLDKKEGDRDKARKSWNEIETIKELKEGYLSQVIHKIATMIVEYNAIVVLEDLNNGFKRIRQGISEKSVYHNFEKMLIDKLNYLVDKKKLPTEDGGLLNAYQLTNKFESFKKMGKQNGFLFYIPSWNTSKIDPVTGFVNLFDARYENIDKTKAFFEKFKSIRYNKAKNYFEFVVDDYSKFSAKAEETRLDWTICTYGDRIITFRNPVKNNQRDNKEVNLTKEFADFFTAQNIVFQNDEELKTAIAARTDKDFFEKLLGLFKLTLQMRNTNNTIDYLISPVADTHGIFYDSRQADDTKPKDADANGAYNIARKGLILVNRIKEKGVEEFEKTKKSDKDGKSQWLPNKEWLNYAQKNNSQER